MKYLILIVLIFSVQITQAKEIVRLKAELQISACQETEDSYGCKVESPNNQDIEIALEQVEGEELGIANGSYEINKSVAGVEYKAHVYISRIKDQNGSTYYINTDLITLIGKQETKKQLGSVVIKDLSLLNTINWYGDDIKNNETDIQSTVMIGPAAVTVKQNSLK